MSLTETVIASADGSTSATFVPGANLVCRSLLVGGRERLTQRRGLDGYVAAGTMMGLPLLYPWANRLSARSFTAAGRDVSLPADPARVHEDEDRPGMPLHGLMPALMRWQLRDPAAVAGADTSLRPDAPRGGWLTATLSWTTPELLALFPFPHELRVDIAVGPGTLTVTTMVSANRGTEVPISFGHHPFLTLTEPREQWQLLLPRCEQIVLDERMLPTGERTPVPAAPLLLAGDGLDAAYVLPAPAAAFTARAGEQRITVTLLEGYRHVQLFSPAGAGFVCIEPMTAPVNALVSGDGLPVLEPGAEYRGRFRIAFAG